MFSAEQVKARCNGMLPASVYQRIYDVARAAPGKVFVEVGAAHGAGTVCLASAMRDSGRDGKIYSFERIVGGSREKFGTFDENVEILKGNLRHFELENFVELVIGDVAETHAAVPASAEIGVLMLDVDGRIDRDIGLFYDRVIAGGDIIIDDVAEKVRLKPLGGRHFRIDQKYLISHLLVQELIKAGLVSDVSKEVDTVFAKKTEARVSDLPPEAVLGAYRELVFANAMRPPSFAHRIVSGAVRTASPALFARLKALFGRTA